MFLIEIGIDLAAPFLCFSQNIVFSGFDNTISVGLLESSVFEQQKNTKTQSEITTNKWNTCLIEISRILNIKLNE